MPIPNNITNEHLLAAISKIDKEGIPKDGDSKFFDVIFNGKKYPPKLIVSYANLFANGEILNRNSFSGGMDTPCFELLKQNKFVIELKKPDNTITYIDELKKFLAQAESGALGTKSYLRNFSNLKVKVSFGQGNPARIPWIAFLKEPDTVPQGIYPVYLYFKERKLLILAYGISETRPANRSWNITNAKSIDQFFEENDLEKPERYGSSFVYKSYEVNEINNEEEIDNDLNNLINIYLSIKTPEPNPMPIKNFQYQAFSQSALSSGLFFEDKITLRFAASVLTKPFVILTGLSGSGKTKLAQAFAMWICENENQYSIVPVGADWTNREPLLGFPNALKQNEYIKPDNKVLDLIIEANKNIEKPYFLILDEMNLSHVERYFADFLSVMESKSKISLHPGKEDWNGVPPNIGFSKNLFIIGTVNIDETTYMFSPKVLDRANVIEFRVTKGEMEEYLDSQSTISLENLIGIGASMSGSFVEIAKDNSLEVEDADEVNLTLMVFFNELKKIGAEFGYRSASEILRFAAVVNKIESTWTTTDIIDAAIMQKLLPKVHGSRRKLEPVLKTLGSLCLNDEYKFDEYLKAPEFKAIKYPISLEKIIRMHDNLISNGFTSYAEA